MLRSGLIALVALALHRTTRSAMGTDVAHRHLAEIHFAVGALTVLVLHHLALGTSVFFVATDRDLLVAAGVWAAFAGLGVVLAGFFALQAGVHIEDALFAL